MDKLQIKVVNEKIGSEIPFPSFSTSGSAGMDLRACLDDQIRIGAINQDTIRCDQVSLD